MNNLGRGAGEQQKIKTITFYSLYTLYYKQCGEELLLIFSLFPNLISNGFYKFHATWKRQLIGFFFQGLKTSSSRLVLVLEKKSIERRPRPRQEYLFLLNFKVGQKTRRYSASNNIVRAH